MPFLRMNGPYKLNNETIDAKVTRASPGNYALGSKSEKSRFRVWYVGRSDDDVNNRLKDWVNKTKRPLFKLSYATSAKAAFEKECNNYHDFDPPGNTSHPARPKGKDWECPRCDIFD